MSTQRNPWLALYALVVGFFMILLDMTIVAVANPAIKSDLDADMSKVIWVTSAYLLTYAIPLLVSGRLGDRFGPKNIYLLGLVVFTGASLWCGLSGSIGALIAARAVQGLGAGLMTPQTMAVITRTFPADKRGAAMGLWGGVAGLATLVGPILGGVLVDNFGWQWIFYVNIPIGIIAFALAAWLVPALPTNPHKFDMPGVVMSSIGTALLVFGLQEGNSEHWSARIWLLIASGVVVLVVFILYQARGKGEPLVPLSLFKDRNFALSSIAIMAMGASIVGMMLPGYFYLEAVRGMSPTKSALVFAPMAVVTGILAPVVGKFSDRVHPRYIPAFGFASLAVALAWLAMVMTPDTAVWQVMLPTFLMGVANACIWAPLGAIATHNLPLQLAGAGAGVYNATRQVGSVLGSAAMSALLTARLSAHHLGGGGGAEGATTALPKPIRQPFSDALAESTLLPAGILLLGIIASALFVRPEHAAVATPEPEKVDVPA